MERITLSTNITQLNVLQSASTPAQTSGTPVETTRGTVPNLIRPGVEMIIYEIGFRLRCIEAISGPTPTSVQPDFTFELFVNSALIAFGTLTPVNVIPRAVPAYEWDTRAVATSPLGVGLISSSSIEIALISAATFDGGGQHAPKVNNSVSFVDFSGIYSEGGNPRPQFPVPLLRSASMR